MIEGALAAAVTPLREEGETLDEEGFEPLAAFLAAANPKSWPLAEMRAMMRGHLDLTTAEAVARLTGDWEADIAAYDEVHRHILGMADALSAGIVRQFPARFRR